MKKAIYALFIPLFASSAFAATTTDNAFENLADEYVSGLTLNEDVPRRKD